MLIIYSASLLLEYGPANKLSLPYNAMSNVATSDLLKTVEVIMVIGAVATHSTSRCHQS